MCKAMAGTRHISLQGQPEIFNILRSKMLAWVAVYQSTFNALLITSVV